MEPGDPAVGGVTGLNKWQRGALQRQERFKHVTHAIMSMLLNPDHRNVLGIDLLQGSLKLVLIHPKILSISQHLRYAAYNLARFKCNPCNYFFSLVAALNNHITNQHLAFTMLVLNSTVLTFNLKI